MIEKGITHINFQVNAYILAGVTNVTNALFRASEKLKYPKKRSYWNQARLPFMQSRSFERKVKKLSKQDKLALDKQIRTLAENPSIGEEKKGEQNIQASFISLLRSVIVSVRLDRKPQ